MEGAEEGEGEGEVVEAFASFAEACDDEESHVFWFWSPSSSLAVDYI